ncbi:histone-lysine N-methyltransferase SETMAR [Plakobranchus ocellatus]|uniref:Histone-lysine N-methyltransferase SETMAR n=1 Tax=Plakobranchus ocellatus TaxID=259542 RepID=A0AAV4CQ87_9GAST|nr:histone-lysine N-methyltransferase SETMAR [Plakobranchus ocellatus]
MQSTNTITFSRLWIFIESLNSWAIGKVSNNSLISHWRDLKGVILLDILPQGQCINAARYCSTLDRLKEAIRRKRPGLLRRGVMLQHDNATPHSANLTQHYSWEILPHPAHCPDLAPSDFHLFGPFKRHLGGMAFETEDDLISELRNWFDKLDVDFFRVGINLLLHRSPRGLR